VLTAKAFQMTLFAVIFLPTSFIHWLSFDFFLFFYFVFFKNETSSFWIHLTRPTNTTTTMTRGRRYLWRRFRARELQENWKIFFYF
jgi:hypothetical protein